MKIQLSFLKLLKGSKYFPLQRLSIIKYYNEVLCTENYTQIHMHLEVPEATLLEESLLKHEERD